MTSCKGCGREIVRGTTADGKRIPLDPKPPVYGVKEGVCFRVKDVMVSHFATCSKANQFSGKSRQP